jgi:hypothetical protein
VGSKEAANWLLFPLVLCSCLGSAPPFSRGRNWKEENGPRTGQEEAKTKAKKRKKERIRKGKDTEELNEIPNRNEY